jgi:hypothetical protein
LKKYPKIQIKTSNKVYHVKQTNKLSYVCYSTINKHHLFFFFDKFITCTLPQDPLYENTLVSLVINKKLNNEVIIECSFKNLFNFLEIEQFFDDRQERFFIDNYNFLNIKFFFNDYFFFDKHYIKSSIYFFFNFFRFPIKYK